MRFSVIVPVYNIEKYLDDCMNSILGQKFQDYEIILINDGSLDKSGQRCEEYQKKYGCIKYINKKNGGPSSARRAGAEIAEGDYIICVDGDDYISGDLLETISNCIDNIPESDMVCFGYYRDVNGIVSDPIYNALKEGFYNDLGPIKEKYLYDPCCPSENIGCLIYPLWSKAIRRELFQMCQNEVPDYIKNGEDTLLSGMCLANAKSITVLQFAGYYYRENPCSITHKRMQIDLINMNNVKNEFEKLGAYPMCNITHYYLKSIGILVSDMARQQNKYKEFQGLLSGFKLDSIDHVIKPYGPKTSLRNRLKYYLIQKEYWFLIYCIEKIR